MALDGIFDPIVRALLKGDDSGGVSGADSMWVKYDSTQEYESFTSPQFGCELHKVSDSVPSAADFAGGIMLLSNDLPGLVGISQGNAIGAKFYAFDVSVEDTGNEIGVGENKFVMVVPTTVSGDAINICFCAVGEEFLDTEVNVGALQFPSSGVWANTAGLDISAMQLIWQPT